MAKAKDQAKAPAKREGGKKKAAPERPVVDETPAPRPRLLEHYVETVRPALRREFAYGNVHQVPRLSKIVLNVGMGQAPKQPKALEAAVAELGAITGQRPVVTRARKAIANFGLRAGMPIGAMVTLRGAHMWEFLDRFISIAVPRIRDFRGFPTRSFDGRGNFSTGIKEQMVFPEIDYDQVERIHGMDITICTTARRDDEAMALLRELGMPFRGQTPVAVG